MDKKHILILGAGVMQLPALKWARARGWFVYAADGNPQAVGIPLANRFIHVDLTDVEGMIAAASDIKKRERLDGVFTAGTDFSYTVARVAEALDLPGLPPEVAYRATNKAEMRRVLKEHGVSSPGFTILQDDSSPDEAIRDLRFPLVVKPVDNMGARGIRRIDTRQEYRQAIEDARQHSRCGTVIVEEYIPGREFSIDALVVRGQVLYTGIADRHIFFPPYFVEMGHTIPTGEDGEVLKCVKETFEAAVHAIGIDNGAAKGDVKWDGQRAVIGEVAARLSGGYMSGWTYPYCSGVELTGAALLQAVGETPEGLTPVRDRVSAERAFISIPGIVESVECIEEAKEITGIKEIFIRVGQGDSIDFPTNNVEKCGNFIAVADSRKDAVQAAEEACRAVFVRLKPENRRTREFLHDSRAGWIPNAFELEHPDNIAALEAMPEMKPTRMTESESQHADLHTADLRIGVLPLPRIDEEKSRDWHGMALPSAFRRALELSQLTLVDADNDADIIVGSLFWNAFLKGGLQAGVWIADTIRREGRGV